LLDMTRAQNALFGLVIGAGFAAMAPVAWAEPGHQGGPRDRQAAAPAHPAEPERGPQRYQRVERPVGADARPQQFDRQVYNHNFTADRSYHIGPYHAPHGYAYRRWGYGEVLPRYYWAQQYWLTDYWLFGLEVPPVGFEWVRYGPDALLINTDNGEVIQVVYGRFL
jgi:Ni/Co efflux regulator RcnB